MKEPSITVGGMPLEEALAFQQREEIAQHFNSELSTPETAVAFGKEVALRISVFTVREGQ